MAKISAFVCLIIVAGALAEFKEEDGVLVLTKDTFDKALEEFKYVLVEFCKLIDLTVFVAPFHPEGLKHTVPVGLTRLAP